MDVKTKNELLEFMNSGLERLGDLATWIQNPQRRFHRHEFFGVSVATFEPQNTKTRLKLRDIGYGGCALEGAEGWSGEASKVGDIVHGTITYLGEGHPFSLRPRHHQKIHIGCEFDEITDEQTTFLRHFIQYMDAALQVRQADTAAVFKSFQGEDWLNLVGHNHSLQFHIRRVPNGSDIDATLLFVMNRRHIFASWRNQRFEMGFLEGPTPTANDQKLMFLQVISMLVGMRQGASLPNFSTVIERAVEAMRKQF